MLKKASDCLLALAANKQKEVFLSIILFLLAFLWMTKSLISKDTAFSILSTDRLILRSKYHPVFNPQPPCNYIDNGHSSVPWQPLFKKPKSAGKQILVPSLPASPSCPGNRPCIAFGTTYFFSNTSWSSMIKRWQSKKTSKCSLQCDIVSDANQADAVVFNGRDLNGSLPWHTRHPDQHFVYLNLESPHATKYYGYDVTADQFYRFLFNWTASYSLNSDIYIPHGAIELRQRPRPPQEQFYSPELKEDFAYIMTSHCNPFNMRQAKIRQLQKVMELHAFGKCFNRQVPGGFDVFLNMSKKYRFYFSFENSFCRDYITEKFFNNGLMTEAVPVVIGGLSKEEYEYFAPPHSFIYALDFKKASDLVQHLQRIASNETEYAKFHRWKRLYRVTSRVREDLIICKICEKVWKDGCRRSTSDLRNYYSVEDQCLPQNHPYLID